MEFELDRLALVETHVFLVLTKIVKKNRSLKGGESSSQFQWFTIAKIEQ